MSAIKDIEDLLRKTAQQAILPDTSIENRIDALRVMGSYYTALKKAAGQEPPDPGGDPTMDDMRSQIEESGNGRAVQTRSRSRN
jgi:hypothetical protein